MKPDSSPKAWHVVEEWGVPKVTWQQLERSKVLGRGHFAIVYSATLTLPDNQRVAVALKNLIDKPLIPVRIPLEEARVLQALAGVEGVPRLYGITELPPHVLVMSQCPGYPLSVWRQRGKVRTCLMAVRGLCVILTKMHGRGITHGDIHGSNVLVSVSDGKCETSVWIVDFGLAKRNADSKAIRTDVQQVLKLLTNIILTMEVNSDTDIYQRRQEIIIKSMNNNLTLDEISSLVSSVLHGRREKTFRIHDP